MVRFLVAFFIVVLPLEAMAEIPAQFLARMYTEVLGRFPDQSGWAYYENKFRAEGCSQSTLKTHGTTFYTSTEFDRLGYDTEARVYTLYRGVLSREPDVNGFNHHVSMLNRGTSWTSVVHGFFNSMEFAGHVGDICANRPRGWGKAAPVQLPMTRTGAFPGGNASDLQVLLNAASTGETVYLEQRAIVMLDKRITVPAGVTLATVGHPSPRYYANMARLVRKSGSGSGGGFDRNKGELINLASGASLESVWVDGRRQDYFESCQPATYSDSTCNLINVRIYGGSNVTVQNNRLTNTSGWTTVQALGKSEGHPCSNIRLTGNLITAYGSRHIKTGSLSPWTDGLSVACEDTLVENNGVIDATDVAIVVFRSSAGQSSKVRNNKALQAGNSAYGGYVADSLGLAEVVMELVCEQVRPGETDCYWQPKKWCADGDRTDYYDFTGTVFHGNTIWTGAANVHVEIGLSVGTRPWFGDHTAPAYGVQFTENTSGSLSLNANEAIAVAGMCDAVVLDNSINATTRSYAHCPVAHTVAARSAGHASGWLQSYVDADPKSCVSH